MAGQSGHLSIPRSKAGVPRLPFEQSDAGEYSAPGPVVTYQLSPEEISARYGPPSPGGKQRLTRAALKWAAEHAGSLAEAIEKLNCVAVPENWKETEKMSNFEVYKAQTETQPETRTVPVSYRITVRLTVAQAVELRDEIIEDLDDLNRIIALATRDFDAPPDRVMSLLNWHRDQYQLSLDWIEVTFATTEITL